MNNERLFELIGEIKEEFIAEAEKTDLKEKGKKKEEKMKWITIAVAAAVAVSVLLPNINGNLALAMEKIPFFGKYFKIVTIRDYQYQDEQNQAEVQIPQVVVEDNVTDREKETAVSFNKRIEEYAEGFMKKFQENLKAEGEGYQELSMDYQVITDNDHWLSLKISALEVQASGYQQVKYFHIDKSTGEEAILSDLFVEGSDYVDRISQNIIVQMQEAEAEDEGKVYFYQGMKDSTGLAEEDLFRQISPEQNFYFNAQGALVIAFNEYEVAPGYMGVVEFVIPDEVISDILK